MLLAAGRDGYFFSLQVVGGSTTTMHRCTGRGIPISIGLQNSVEQNRQCAAAWGTDWLSLHAAATARPAVVFDIDSTLVVGDTPIPSMCQLYQRAAELGVAVFVITARSSKGKKDALDDLSRLGLPAPRHLFTHPSHQPLECARDAALQKSIARSRIADKGYAVVLNVGDAVGDHVANPADRLPGGDVIRKDDVAVYIHEGVAHIKLPTVRTEKGR